MCKESTVIKKTGSYRARICFVMGGLTLVNTLKPQMHFISGSLSSSALETSMPHFRHEYTTSNFVGSVSGRSSVSMFS